MKVTNKMQLYRLIYNS